MVEESKIVVAMGGGDQEGEAVHGFRKGEAFFFLLARPSSVSRFRKQPAD